MLVLYTIKILMRVLKKGQKNLIIILILCYNGPTTFKVVKNITDSLNCPIPIALEQVKRLF